MPLIELANVSKDWGDEPLFSGLELRIEEGEKLGLVGPNGSGKTSLLNVIAGIDEDFRGRISRAPGLRVGLVAQRFEPTEGLSCVEVLTERAVALRTSLAVIEEKLSALNSEAPGGEENRGLLEEYGELVSSYEALGGAGAEEAALRILARAGLGAVADSPASSLSGGEKNVLSIARALALAPDLLLLDEPGNHLDFSGLAWLEEFVRGERRALVMVSHNRALLDRGVDRILEIDRGAAREYSGGYSAYRIEKLSRAAGQGKDWQAGRKKVERLEALVRRFAQIAAARPDPAWGKRLRARRSQLEREKEAAAAKPSGDSPRMSVTFAAAETKADYAVVVQGYRKAYGERVLFEDAGFDLLAGERAALVGPNGAGKTSFLRDLVACGEEEGAARWEGGRAIRVGPSMRIGYCAQEQELFTDGKTVGEEFEALGAGPEEAFRLLKRYLFDRSILEAEVDSLSGGERGRLQIARAVFLGANFLVLDEPTNHLDIESREALEEGLVGFSGTILTVSHDKWFLEKVAERIILVEDGAFLPYEGSFAEYWRDRGSARASSRPRAERRADEGMASGHRAVRDLEARITALEKEKEALEAASARAIASRDFERAGKAASLARAKAAMLARLYAEWERVEKG